MPTVLITGASGFIGKNLIEFLNKKKNVKLVCLDKKRLPKKFCVDFIQGDITNKEHLEKIFRKYKIDFIIHLAAVVHSKNKNEFIKTNIHGTRNLLNLARRMKVKKIVFLSTDLVIYKNLTKSWYRETKRLGEEIIKNSGVKYVILRPTPVYGKYDERNFGKLIKVVRKYKILPYIACIFQPVHVDDVVKMIVKSLFSSRIVNKEYELAGKKIISLKQIFLSTSKKLGVRRILIPIPILIFKPLVFYYEKISKNPIIWYYQIDKWSKTRPIYYHDARKDLEFDPAPFEI